MHNDDSLADLSEDFLGLSFGKWVEDAGFKVTVRSPFHCNANLRVYSKPPKKLKKERALLVAISDYRPNDQWSLSIWLSFWLRTLENLAMPRISGK